LQELLTIVEQLDRASTELLTDHPINNRLALILIDNATELMLHGQCTSHLESDSFYSPMLKAYQSILERDPAADVTAQMNDIAKHALTPRQRSRAKGKSLDDKLKVLKDKGDLITSERRFIAIAHEYRNELYHVGLAHADITRALAAQYFLLACDLLPRVRNSFLWGESISSADTYTDIAKRYLPMRGDKVDPSHLSDITREQLAEKLRFNLPSGLPNLAETLALSAQSSIERVMANFGFLMDNNPFGLDKAEMLETAQWQLDLSKELERRDVDGLWVDPNYRQALARVAIVLEEDWRQKYNSIPEESWRRRSGAIRQEMNPLIALGKYQNLRDDMSYLEEAFESASEDLDRWIQHQVDLARGK